MTVAQSAEDLVASIPKQLFIAGEWRDATGGRTLDVHDPASGEVLAAGAEAQAMLGDDFSLTNAVLVITSLLLVVLVLLHKGRGGGMSEMFGGGMSTSLGGSSVAERNLDRITGELIAEGYDLFDPACRDAMRLFSEKLSVGLVNLIDIFNPERIILSGGVSGAGRRLLDGVMPLVEANLMTPAQKCDIVIGELFSDAGALGACALAAEGEGK